MQNPKIVSCYRNLRNHCISVIKGGETLHREAVTLSNVRFHVREGREENPQRGTRQWVVQNKRKTVHALVKGVECEQQINTDELIKVSYNPYKSKFFFIVETGEPIFEAEFAIVTPGGVWVK